MTALLKTLLVIVRSQHIVDISARCSQQWSGSRGGLLIRARISLPDTLMSAFAMFSVKSPSLLAFDDERKEGNLQQVYGIGQVPCDTRMREILDPP